MAANNEDISTYPLTYELPDGDVVQLCTWEFVLAKLTQLIDPLVQLLTIENQDLTGIKNRIDEWIEEQREDSE